MQWASEAVIAAVERNGGFITTAYYDPMALDAAVNPKIFFKRGTVLVYLLFIYLFVYLI